MKREVLPLTDEEKLEYCNMHFDCLECSGSQEGRCPLATRELSDERIDEIRMKLIKGNK